MLFFKTNEDLKSKFDTLKGLEANSQKDSSLTVDDFIKNRSIYDFETEVSKDNKILTLSTCYDDYSKVVLHAKLIKSN